MVMCSFKSPALWAGEMLRSWSTGCSSQGPGLDSRHPHQGFQPPVTPVPKDLMPFWASVCAAYMWYTDIYVSKRLIHNLKKF